MSLIVLQVRIIDCSPFYIILKVFKPIFHACFSTHAIIESFFLEYLNFLLYKIEFNVLNRFVHVWSHTLFFFFRIFCLLEKIVRKAVTDKKVDFQYSALSLIVTVCEKVRKS